MTISRRTFVQAAAAVAILPAPATGQATAPMMRPLPSSGEQIPAIGLGTWITFNVGDDPVLRDECADVMNAFFEAGGRMIDSSPMYGSSQPVIGYGLQKLGRPETLFSAEKVWTSSGADGPRQIEQSRRFWGVPRFDLIQVHNLLAWQAHLRTLFEMKAAGAVRYVGITTSEGRRHDLVERIMRSEPIDFVQFSYNVVDREAEDAAPAAGGGARHRRDRQPAVPAGRADPSARGRAAARMGGRARCVELGAIHPEVHPLPPGGHRRDSRDDACRPCAREPRGCRRPDAGPGHAGAHGGATCRIFDVGVVDLPT